VNILRYNYRFAQLTHAFAHQMLIDHSYFQGPFFFVDSVSTKSGTHSQEIIFDFELLVLV
jgi:hypothetical protein